MNRLVLGIAGSSGSGKSSLSRHLAERYGLCAIDGSTVIKQLAKHHAVELHNREGYDTFYRESQRQLGLDWLSRYILEQSHSAVHVGLRNRSDAQNIKAHGGFVVALFCPDETAFERTDKTNPKNAQTIEEYRVQSLSHNSPDEFGSHVDWVIDHADHVIDARRSLSDVQAAAEYVADYHLSTSR